ncbi:FAD synthase-like [Vespa mandarinia]|uniref:FAD synthase-like n=1 Tax=Vespa mandarinia TaxID=7446 RepID=UPI00160A925D|nr:FAD synthase-like [Vespa mandarinia]
MEMYTAGLIVIGNEILRGQIVDTNTSYLAQKLRNIGVKLCKITVVPDIVEEIAQEVSEASKKYSIVFTSGGVGPTHDDVTYEGIAQALKVKLELHQELLNFYTQLLIGKTEIERLSIVPCPCDLIYVNSTDDYAVIKISNIYVLPGSPKYFKSAVDTIMPKLKKGNPLHFDYIDIESDELSLVKILDEQAQRWKDKVNIGSYPQGESSFVNPTVRITFEGLENDVIKAKQELISCIPTHIIQNIKERFSIEQAELVINSSNSEEHVQCAIDILKQCYDKYDSNEIFLSFNGGKDCTVVLHLAACICALRKISSPLCLYVAADPFSEVEAFVEEAANYYGLELIRKEPPLRLALDKLINDKYYLKASLMGTRKGDPGSEKLKAFTVTDSGWPNIMRVNPILYWTYSQVWRFLLKHKVPYCSLYDKGYTSIGTKTTTLPNPLLKDPQNPSNYLPAYTLNDISAERQGRE